MTAHVVVDGSNIATEGRTTPSLEQLDEAVRTFMNDHPHDLVTVVVDATFGHRIAASERERYEEAVLAGELITPPAGALGRGDAFVLEIADRANATVLSNDSFQEFHGKYPWLFDEGRLIGGKPVPHVGWIFMLRTPVRGPASRRSVRAAKTPAPRKTAAAKRSAKKAPASRKRAAAPVPEAAETALALEPPPRGAPRARRRRTTGEPINEPLVFLEFVANHPLGSTVEAEIERFSSHGAYVQANGARCYVPLKAMADPPPRSARELFQLGEVRPFVVQSFDSPRRGIDLAVPGFESIEGPPVDVLSGADGGADVIPAVDPAEEAPVLKKAASRKRATSRKGAAKRSTAKKKSTAKRSAARKSTARKGTAKKRTAKKAAKKAAKKRGGAKKAAKRGAAKKRSTKKSAARRR